MHETHKLAVQRQLETAEQAESYALKIDALSNLLLSMNNKFQETNTHQHMHHALNTETIHSGYHGINKFIDA